MTKGARQIPDTAGEFVSSWLRGGSEREKGGGAGGREGPFIPPGAEAAQVEPRGREHVLEARLGEADVPCPAQVTDPEAFGERALDSGARIVLRLERCRGLVLAGGPPRPPGRAGAGRAPPGGA